MLNPKLKPGDRIRLLYMEGESLTPNTWGTVKSVYNVFGSDDYSVVWDDGDKVASVLLPVGSALDFQHTLGIRVTEV